MTRFGSVGLSNLFILVFSSGSSCSTLPLILSAMVLCRESETRNPRVVPCLISVKKVLSGDKYS